MLRQVASTKAKPPLNLCWWKGAKHTVSATFLFQVFELVQKPIRFVRMGNVLCINVFLEAAPSGPPCPAGVI